MSQIAFIGDTQIDSKKCSDKLNASLSYLRGEYPELTTVIQVGDFGYWPSSKHLGHHLNSLRVPDGIKLYWIDGNHEDFNQMQKWDILNKLSPFKNHKAYYVPRGTVLNLCGHEILFIGGAESIDVLYRKNGVNWFPQESITDQDVEKCLAAVDGKKIDIVVSHDAPRSFHLYNLNPFGWQEFGWKKREDYKDYSKDRLETIMQAVKPSWWFFGHYHLSMHGFQDNINWRCLDQFEFYILDGKE